MVTTKQVKSLSPRIQWWWDKLAIRGEIKCQCFWLDNCTLYPFHSSHKGLLLLNTCIMTLLVAYWLFLLTTWTWALNPTDNNYLSKNKNKKRKLKKIRFDVFRFHYRSTYSWKNMYLSRFQHLAGDAGNTVVILEPGWQIQASVVKTNQGFSHTPSFLILFFPSSFDSHT